MAWCHQLTLVKVMAWNHQVTNLFCLNWEPVKRPHSKTATTRTATLNGLTTRTATLLWSKRPHRFGQNGHIGWVATKTVTLFWSKRPQGGLYLNEQKWLPKRPHCIWSKRPQIVSDINFVKSEYLNVFAWHPKTFIIQLWISKIYLWMDFHYYILDIHNYIMNIHNSCWFMDIHNWYP